MRRLVTRRPRAGHARGRSTGHHPERGATAVIVAVMMTMLLGFAAISVDVGRIYWEKAQLQNGADTAALSIANACAKSPTDPGCTDYQNKAQVLANASANDGLTQVPPVTLDLAAGRVTTVTRAAESSGPAFGRLSVFFAQVLDPAYADGVPVSATASASWGAPKRVISKFPLAFSRCEMDASPTTDGTLQFIMSHGVKDPVREDKCHDTGSGLEIPGGFGWLPPNPTGSCNVDTTAGTWIVAKGGNAWETNCSARMAEWKATLESGGRVVALLPVFDATDKKNYRIWAHAAFEIRGWYFTAGGGPSYMTTDAAETFRYSRREQSDMGFVGRFVRYVFTDDEAFAATTGSAPSTTGANIVTLSR
ncbi:hypothetical protein NCCP1664_01200 [Zafaria cholistanensis]|uniref:Putative Flp pilus-assembly TadG-like N-terminal domain-containing protein n=1 Tax=Zafaria cholistanensis TaxID=1682741 RepID=A0A5A7NKY6_9MICC|nr:pilus assembly protein TadG-related protein [Zafaria cholistanensis]GER21623.1 hypothetical protein NCCP1664_01200 [Zafaria cholistanensis]